MSWSALVIVGDGNGYVGAGLGKARQIPDAIRKGVEAAKKNIVRIPLVGGTIPHEIVSKDGAAEVMLKPASAGTGIVAGSSMRTIFELGGVHDVLGKSLGSNNSVNIAWATLKALRDMKTPAEVASARGKSVAEITPWVERIKEHTNAR